MKKLLLLLALGGCAPAMEIHGGLGPKPAPPEAIWWGSGMATDAALQVAHVKPIPRVAVMIGTGLVLRNVCAGPNCRYFGRTVDSGFLFTISGFFPEWAHLIGKALHL